MPAEGGHRVAIIEGAERMNEDAQSALLKTLEEPPAGVTIVLCADGEARLLPTVRSRCARVRLGLSGRATSRRSSPTTALADPPTAARLGRLAGGRPGLALAYARAPGGRPHPGRAGALLLDLTDARPSARLAAARAAVPRAIALAAALDGGGDRPRPPRPHAAARRRARSPRLPAATSRSGARAAAPTDDATAAPTTSRSRARVPATERRRAVEVLLGLWTDVARDLVLVGSGGARSVRDTVLLEELARDRGRVAPGSADGVPRALGARPRSCSRRTSRPSSSSMRWCSPGRAAAPPPEPADARDRRTGRPVGSTRPSGAASRASASATSSCARRWTLGLDGWVANDAGRLGPRASRRARATDLDALLERLREGPPAAIVERVIEAWMPATGTLGPFGVRSGAHAATDGRRLTR